MTPAGRCSRQTLAGCLIVVTVRLIVVQGFWPAEDSVWSVKTVNTSSLCTNSTVEDVNPEDPAIWQFTRKPVPQQYSFFQHVHSLFGKSFENEGHPQVTGPL